MIVSKTTYRITDYSTVRGDLLGNIEIGFETYGRLNSTADNAILVCHPFPATSHVAGRYAADDPLPGFWDALIGPCKALDTQKYFVIGVDSLCNLNVRDGRTPVNGPTMPTRTGTPIGASYPEVEIRDFVEVQRRVLDHLGVARLHAVAGPSMGSMQAFEWAVAYPERVGRVIAALPLASCDPYTTAMIARWVRPIDTAIEQGRTDPTSLHAALIDSFDILALDAQGRGDLDRRFADAPQACLDTLRAEASSRAAMSDALTFKRLANCIGRFSLGYGLKPSAAFDRYQAPTLLAPAETDELFPPYLAEATAAELQRRGRPVKTISIPGDGGHRDGSGLSVGRIATEVKAFVEAAL